MLKIRSNKQGFSLIELLVVVTIIGVLAAVAIPSYNKYQDGAAANTAKISAKSIYKAIAICLASGAEADDTECGSTKVNNTLDKACAIGAAAAATDTVKNTCVLKVASSTDYCVSVNVDDKIFCIDSAGVNSATDDSSSTLKLECVVAGTCVT